MDGIKTIELYNSQHPSKHKHAADICLARGGVQGKGGNSRWQLQRLSAWQQLEEEGSEGWPNSSLCTEIKGEA